MAAAALELPLEESLEKLIKPITELPPAAHQCSAAPGGAGFDSAAVADDWARAARLGAYGLALDGPLGALWYDLRVRRQGGGGQGPLGARG